MTASPWHKRPHRHRDTEVGLDRLNRRFRCASRRLGLPPRRRSGRRATPVTIAAFALLFGLLVAEDRGLISLAGGNLTFGSSEVETGIGRVVGRDRTATLPPLSERARPQWLFYALPSALALQGCYRVDFRATTGPTSLICLALGAVEEGVVGGIHLLAIGGLLFSAGIFLGRRGDHRRRMNSQDVRNTQVAFNAFGSVMQSLASRHRSDRGDRNRTSRDLVGWGLSATGLVVGLIGLVGLIWPMDG